MKRLVRTLRARDRLVIKVGGRVVVVELCGRRTVAVEHDESVEVRCEEKRRAVE